MEKTNKQIAESIINELEKRVGFNYWWINVDEDIKEEIVDDLVKVLGGDQEDKPFYCIIEDDGNNIVCDTQCFTCKYKNNIK